MAAFPVIVERVSARNRSGSAVAGRRADIGRILAKARQAILMELWIADRAAFFAHPRLAKRAIGFEEPVVVLALHDVSPRRLTARHVGSRG